MKKKLTVAAASVVLGVAVLAGCAGNAPAPTHWLTAYDKALQNSNVVIGDCILSDGSTTFEKVSCDEPHSDEVYSIVNFNTGKFTTDKKKIADSFYTPVGYQSYIGGELPDGKTNPTLGVWGVRAHSFNDSEDLWDKGFHRAVYTVTTGKKDNQVGSVKGVLAAKS